jgi:hypothetical protein
VSYTNSKRHRAIGARGPVCDEVVRHPCAVCGAFPTDPAHLQRVGRGFGDWLWRPRLRRWVCRVTPLDRLGCHARFDGNVVGGAQPFRASELDRMVRRAERIGEDWARAIGVDLGDALHPYQQWDRLGRPQVADLNI